MTNKAMQFLFGDRELLLQARDLLTLPVDVIVNATDSALSHQNATAAHILEQAGDEMAHQSRQLIRQYGEIEPSMAVYTSAGNLPFEAVIHTVAPAAEQVDTQACLQQAISRCLMLCETNDWRSIAFPAVGGNEAAIPVSICAQAFFRAITSFWDARLECAVQKIIICPPEEQFRPFFDAFREDALPETETEVTTKESGDAGDANIGYVEIDQEDLEQFEDDDIASWFK